MGARTVLIVDDGEDNRIILSRCVRRAGYEALMAEGAAQALERIEGQTPDLVLLDWNMPGLSGLDLLKAIRGRHSVEQLPVIMCTARSASRDVQTALAAGANDFLTKPIDVPVAIARIEAQLQRLNATKALEAMNDELEQAVAQRTRALLNVAPNVQEVSERGKALDEILRLTKWLEEPEAADEDLRRACAVSIEAAARALAQS